MKQLPFASLPKKVQAQLNQLLQKNADQLTDTEFNFMRGRRMYLSAEQGKYFGLDGDLRLPQAPNEEGEEGNETGGEKQLTGKEAKKRLKELGVTFSGRLKVAELNELVREAEAKQE